MVWLGHYVVHVAFEVDSDEDFEDFEDFEDVEDVIEWVAEECKCHVVHDEMNDRYIAIFIENKPCKKPTGRKHINRLKKLGANNVYVEDIGEVNPT